MLLLSCFLLSIGVVALPDSFLLLYLLYFFLFSLDTWHFCIAGFSFTGPPLFGACVARTFPRYKCTYFFLTLPCRVCAIKCALVVASVAHIRLVCVGWAAVPRMVVVLLDMCSTYLESCVELLLIILGHGAPPHSHSTPSPCTCSKLQPPPVFKTVAARLSSYENYLAFIVL